jgi:hypothetical protein
MPRRKRQTDGFKPADIVADVQQRRMAKQQGYRAQALALFPHVCGRCGREFSGKRLRELTVHHKDHNHMNNPADGSNWELLCLYCHDNEHAIDPNSGVSGGTTMERHNEGSLDYNPFQALKDKLNPSSEE